MNAFFQQQTVSVQMIWKLEARRATDDLNSSLTQEFTYAHDGAEYGAGKADSHSEDNAAGHY